MESASTATGTALSRWSLAFLSSPLKVTAARRMSPPERSLVVVLRMECAAVGVHFKNLIVRLAAGQRRVKGEGFHDESRWDEQHRGTLEPSSWMAETQIVGRKR